MNHLQKKLKRKVLRKTVEINAALKLFIQPFKEMPSTNNIDKECSDRINAHELFSLYTANVINEDIIYAR